MKKWYKVIRGLGLVVLSAVMLGAIGCQNAEDAAEETGDALEDAGEAAMDAAEEAGDQMQDAVDEVDDEL